MTLLPRSLATPLFRHILPSLVLVSHLVLGNILFNTQKVSQSCQVGCWRLDMQQASQ